LIGLIEDIGWIPFVPRNRIHVGIQTSTDSWYAAADAMLL